MAEAQVRSMTDHDPTVAATMALMVTRNCNMSCGHCSVESRPGIREQPDRRQLVDVIRQAAAAGVRSILFTGGEPMLRRELVVDLMHVCQSLGITSAMATNGFWGKTLAGAREHLAELRRAGLVRLNVSYDRYHAQFQGSQPILHIAQAADDLGFSFNVTVTREADDRELEEIVAPLRDLRNVMLRFYDVQPVGTARSLPIAGLRTECEGFCSSCRFPAVTDDGRVTACNGPAYFEAASSPLMLGSLRDRTLGHLLKQHAFDPILDTIRTFGPARLRSELQKIPGFEDFPFRQQYHGMCELCQHITRDEAAVTALREHLQRPAAAAERVAVKRLMTESKNNGLLNRDYVNGAGACRTFLRAATRPESRWTDESQKILGRADLDWNHLAKYLIACGLARNILPLLQDHELARWMPGFFAERIRQAAMTGGIKEIALRDVLQTLSTELGRIDGTGVLLKGAAYLAQSLQDGSEEATPARTAGDIDIYVEPSNVLTLRSLLLDAGFSGCSDAEMDQYRNFYHLPKMQCRGIVVEIHKRIGPDWSPMPEQEMLARSLPVNLEGYRNLRLLDAEGMVLHCMTHLTKHWFAQGLKAAWDLNWVLQRADGFDWDRLRTWVQSCRYPREFWLPLTVLTEELELPVPADFLAARPRDAAQQRLESLTRDRVFREIEQKGVLVHTNPFTGVLREFDLRDSLDYRVRRLTQLAIGQFRRLRQPGKQRPISEYPRLLVRALRAR